MGPRYYGERRIRRCFASSPFDAGAETIGSALNRAGRIHHVWRAFCEKDATDSRISGGPYTPPSPISYSSDKPFAIKEDCLDEVAS